MRRSLALVLHAGAVGIMAFGWFALGEVGSWMKTQKGGYFQFLTNQGLVVSLLCMFVSLFCDLFPSIKVIRQIKRSILMISLPLEFVVTTIYWSLLSFFPHLIVLPLAESEQTPGAPLKLMHIPLKTDLALHAVPLFSLLIDFFVFESKFTKAHAKAAPAVVVAFAIWYGSFVEYCATFNGSFPYPFLTHSPFPGRVLIYTITAGIALSCFRTLNALHA